MEVVVPLAKLEQPELAKLTLFVRGQEGASTPAVSCNDSITIELHGTDEQGNRRRIDLADFDACTKLVLSSDLPADVVTATQSPWAQSGDGLEMTMELGGKAGEFDIELDPGHTHYGICDTLRVNLIAGEPDKVVASLASGDATVENGKELVINAQLVDSDGNEVDAAQGVEWTVQPVAEGVAEGSSQGSDGGDGAAAGELLRFHDKRKPKGATAELRADVLTVRPLHARESFDLLVLARFKRGGVFHTLETEQPLNVTISPGCRVIAGLEAFCVQATTSPYPPDLPQVTMNHHLARARALWQDDDGGDSKEVDADELPRVTGEPVADSLTVVADGCLPKLAVRAPFEDGSHLKKITTCQLAVKAFSGRALVERKRDGDPVELHIAGQDPTQALLVEGLKAPTSAGQYTLELRLSFGSTKELPQKELLQGAKRYEVTKTIQVIVTAGPPAELTPKMMLEQGGALKVVGNEELPLQGDLAWLIDASKNKLASDAAVTLTLAPYASGSQDEPAMTLALAQPAATLNLANGVLTAPKLQLSGEAPSGRYELKFELQVISHPRHPTPASPHQPCLSSSMQADRAVHGRILLDYENPADRGKREEVLERQKKQLQAKKERLLAEQKEETELAKRQKTCSGAVKEKERVYERIAKEREDVKSNITQKRGRLDALNLDTESAKRLKASYGLGQGDAAMASASAGSQQPSALGAKVIRPKLAELKQSLTVGVNDGEGSNVRKRKRDFPVEMPNEDDGGHVQLELRRVDALPAGSGASSSQQPFGLYKAVSRSGNEVSAERIGEQELQEDRTGEYLLDALQKESLFETGRVADARISDVIVALRHGTDAALLAPPRVDETMPTKLSLQTGHLRGIAVLAPPPEEEKKALMARIDPGTGLLKVGAEGGAIHPRDVAGASYLINRIVCDDAEARVAWYRALQSAGGYGDAILFGSSSAMYAHSEQAASSAVLIALQDDTGVLDGGSGFAMISHGEYRVLPKAQAAPQAALCKLGPVKEQDEEQVLSGTAEGERVVKFEKVSKELSELEEEEQSKDREEEEAEIEKVRAAAEQQVLDKELNPLREETIKPLREEIKRLEASLKAATGTPGPASAGKKRARSS